MAVIPFPIANPRRLAAGTPHHGAAPMQSPFGRLSVDEVEALTTLDFFTRIQVDAENGTAVMPHDEEARLVRYLEFHGLRLPRPVKANQVLELCNDLRWSFGPAVRRAAQGEFDIANEFPGLNAKKIEYVRAVAGQEQVKARDMARQVFKDPASRLFLY
jgi:hypothetical protein